VDGMGRRSALALLGSSMSVSLLAACGVGTLPAPTPAPPTTAPPKPLAATAIAAGSTPAAVSAPATTPQATTQGAAQPRRGGTLRTAILGDLPSLDVQFVAPNEIENLWLVFDRLVTYDNALNPQPQLAESWDVGGDYKRIKLNLRQGVQWHSGREFTSDDVKYNLLRVRDRTIGAGTFVNQSNWFTSIDTPDKYTVILGSDEPRPLVFDFLEFFNLVDKTTVEGPDGKTKAVGTGPFSFVEWAQGDHVSFARNQNYWQSGRPYLDGIKVSVIRDQAAMVAQLEAGALDAVKSPPLNDFVRLQADPKYQALVHPNGGLFYLVGVNVQNPPLDNKKVRQALSFALDRKRFVDSILLGIGRPQSLPWPPSSPAYNAGKDSFFTFDLDKARALLATAGVTNLAIDIVLSNSQDGTSLAQIYQADLAKIGVTLNIKPMESAAWLDQVNNRKYNGVYWSSAARTNLLPGTMLSSSRGTDPLNNNSGFKSDAYTQLINAATSEPDAVKQKQIYGQINDLFLDEVFFMSVSPNPPTALARSTVHGITASSLGGFDYADVWLEG
jgi:peptide/nickel transport system substrate-binding protein